MSYINRNLHNKCMNKTFIVLKQFYHEIEIKSITYSKAEQ